MCSRRADARLAVVLVARECAEVQAAAEAAGKAAAEIDAALGDILGE